MAKISKKISAHLDAYLAKSGDDLDFDSGELSNIKKYKQILDKCEGDELNFSNQLQRKNLLPERIRKISYRIAFEMEKEKLPTEEDLKDFTELLGQSEAEIGEGEQKMIKFNELMAIRKRIPKRLFNFIMPAKFYQANQIQQKSQNIKMTAESLLDYISLKTAFCRNRINMAKYDEDGLGSLTREQFSAYYRSEVIPEIDVLRDLEETFEICYMNTVESMFFFFLDPKHSGRIRINDAIVCGFLENAFGLQAGNEDFENWFAPEKTHEQNALFQIYDSNQKNYLTTENFQRIQNGAFTSSFVERLFETHVQSGGGKQMCYEEFVQFQIAYNHLAHPSSLAYFFKVLDIDDNGLITRHELSYFYTELRLAYNSWFMDGAMPEFDDFADQFFDMVKPVDNGKITLNELIKCKQGHDFVLCLASHTEFYRYETRDQENGGGLDQDSEMPLFDEDQPPFSRDDDDEAAFEEGRKSE